MIGLSAGHGIKHFGQSSFVAISPFIKAGLEISAVPFGAIFTAQQVASGLANVPAGILSDMYRRRISWILTFSMACVAIAYLLIGLSPWYWLILVAVVILGTGTSMWHAPAFGTLAARYPERRGLAMSAHLTGAQVGDTLGPLAMGVLLGGTILGIFTWDGLNWRTICYLIAIPSAFTGLVVLTRLRSGGIESTGTLTLGEYFAAARRLVKNRDVLGMVGLQAFRQAAHQSFLVWMVVYLAEELEYSAFSVTAHVSMLTLAGIASTPLLGMASDRIGRKPVIVSTMTFMAAVIFSFLQFDEGVPLSLMIILLGTVVFAVMPIITAAAMDQVERGSEGSATALMFAGGAMIGALAPFIAGIIYAGAGFHGVVMFAGGAAALGAVAAVVLRAAPKRV